MAHLNAMLSNLPQESEPSVSEPTANEIVYADLASSSSSGIDLESSVPLALLALPAPPAADQGQQTESLADDFATIVVNVQSGDLASAGRLVSELFDIKPSQAQRRAQAFARQIVSYPNLPRRLAELGRRLAETNEYAAATLLVECFEFQAIEALAIVHALKSRIAGGETNRS